MSHGAGHRGGRHPLQEADKNRGTGRRHVRDPGQNTSCRDPTYIQAKFPTYLKFSLLLYMHTQRPETRAASSVENYWIVLRNQMYLYL